MNYRERAADIERRAWHMREALLFPLINDDTGKLITDRRITDPRLDAACHNSLFEAAGPGGKVIQAISAYAVHDYCNRYGEAPPDDLLAAAHMTIEQGISALSKNVDGPMGAVLESATATLTTTEGILMRDRMLALVLPVMLHSITPRMVTHIPGTFNQSEIFRVRRVAGSTFGGMTKGQYIDYNFNAQYSSMDQRHLVGTGDGSKTGSSDEFDLVSTDTMGAKMPFKRKSVRIVVDGDIVARDDGEGNISGSYVNATPATVTVTGTVDYDNGVVSPLFSVAVTNLLKVHIMVDIDIEKDPSLIPIMEYREESRVLYPHEAAINAGITLQSLWAMKRERNLNMEGMTMTDLRNVLAAERDRKVLADMRFFAKGAGSWTYTVADGVYFQEYYETLKQKLLDIDAIMMNRTGIAGLSGLVMDPASAALVKSMREPNFSPAPGYRRLPQPHYIGRLFGMWDAFEDPSGTTYTNLCYGKGNGVGEAGYVMGDCLPPLPFKHPVLAGELRYNQTLWSLGYRDIHPFDGRNYFYTLTFVSGD